MKNWLAFGSILFISGTTITGQHAVRYTVQFKPLAIISQDDGKVLTKVPRAKSLTISSYNKECDCFSAVYLDHKGIIPSKDWLSDVYGKSKRSGGLILSDSVKRLITEYRLANDNEPDGVFTLVKSIAVENSDMNRTIGIINKWGYTDGKRIAEGKIWPGMTIDMTLESWGIPYRVNVTRGTWGIREQWVYSDAYLYFENGILSEILKLNKNQ